jgi:Fe-S cluster assembly iron-binding protein IscA
VSTTSALYYPETATSNLHNATPPPPPSSQPSMTTAILNPRNDEDGNPMTVQITPRATKRLHEIMRREKNGEGLYLRITVESGGCHGFQYLISLTSDVDPEEDTIFIASTPGGSLEGGLGEKTAAGWEDIARGKAKVVMDEASLELLKDSKVDFTQELIASQFQIVDNPRASSSCGCGTSFDVKI